MLVRGVRLVPESLRRRPREFAKRHLRTLRRHLGRSPIQQVFKELQRHNVDVHACRALEVFGGDGALHTKDYASQVRSLEIWEIESRLEASLRRAFPAACIRIVDAHQQVHRTDNLYDVIIIDNPERAYGSYCEHFDLFPEIFALLSDSSVLVLDVIAQLDHTTKEKWPHVFDPTFNNVEEHLARRRSFYHTESPETISQETMIRVYEERAHENGFELEWYFYQPRPVLADYLVLKLLKNPSA